MTLLKRLGLDDKSLILVLVSIVTQVVPILISPLFSRIYSPDQFGEFSIILSYCGILTIFFSGKYEMALLLPKHDIDIKAVFQLCLVIISLFLATIFLCLCLWFIYSNEQDLEFDSTYFVIPFYAAFVSLYQVCCYLLLYLKLFKQLSLNRFIKSLLTVVTIAGFGFFVKGLNGLIIGSFIGQMISVLMCFRVLNRESSRFGRLYLIKDFRKLKKVVSKYKNFPKFTLPADLINAIVSQAPIFILSSQFTKTTVGYYGFVLATVQAPISIIASAMLDVFKEESTREFKEYGNCYKSFKKTFLRLFAINSIPLLVILFFGPRIFEIVFGSKWYTAGSFAQIMILMFFIKFISSPLSYTFVLAGKQKLDLFLHIIIFILLVISLLIGVYLKLTATSFLVLISSVFGLIYLVYLFKSYEFSKGYAKESI
jgi:O-antigen/teichoic acid export membrane protein